MKGNKKLWRSILAKWLLGSIGYPLEMDRDLKRLQKNLRLERPYFADSRDMAEGYAKKVKGILMEISVPLKDVLNHFDLEFQNFTQRKFRFEIVYCVRGASQNIKGTGDSKLTKKELVASRKSIP